MVAAACGIQEPIPTTDAVWRRVRAGWIEWHDDRQQWIPTTAALRFDPELSTAWREHVIDRHALDAGAIVRPNWPLVFVADVTELRRAGFGVEHRPDSSNFDECAHTLVSYPEGLTGREQRVLRDAQRERMTLVYGEVPPHAPAGA